MPVQTTPHPSSGRNKSSTSASSSSNPTTSTSATRPYYFWKPHQPGGFLGQWYTSPFTDSTGATYATAEMYMMVQKARLFGDEDVAQMMLTTNDPKEHKAMGRKVKGFNERVWNENKLRIVTEGNYLKFTQSELADILRKELLETGDRELVEASPFDRIWGIGFKEADAEKNRHKWGENLLGRAVMEVRERLRKEEAGKKKE